MFSVMLLPEPAEIFPSFCLRLMIYLLFLLPLQLNSSLIHSARVRQTLELISYQRVNVAADEKYIIEVNQRRVHLD